MLGQSYLVDLCLVLKVFREDDLIYRRPVLWLLLQALFDDHVEILGDALRDRVVLLCAHFFL